MSVPIKYQQLIKLPASFHFNMEREKTCTCFYLVSRLNVIRTRDFLWFRLRHCTVWIKLKRSFLWGKDASSSQQMANRLKCTVIWKLHSSSFRETVDKILLQLGFEKSRTFLRLWKIGNVLPGLVYFSRKWNNTHIKRLPRNAVIFKPRVVILTVVGSM